MPFFCIITSSRLKLLQETDKIGWPQLPGQRLVAEMADFLQAFPFDCHGVIPIMALSAQVRQPEGRNSRSAVKRYPWRSGGVTGEALAFGSRPQRRQR